MPHRFKLTLELNGKSITLTSPELRSETVNMIIEDANTLADRLEKARDNASIIVDSLDPEKWL